jgi:hypothetical protein
MFPTQAMEKAPISNHVEKAEDIVETDTAKWPAFTILNGDGLNFFSEYQV